jgi:hypothetical protein
LREGFDAEHNVGIRLMGDFTTPRVAIKTGLIEPDGRDEELTEYLCDYPNCPNIATRMLGCLVELRLMAAVCEEHSTNLGT